MTKVPLLVGPNTKVKVKAIIFGCIDPRLQEHHHHLIHEVLNYEFGEYFPLTSAGSLNDLVSPCLKVRSNSINVLKLMLNKGVTEVNFWTHTQCAADELLHKFKPVGLNPDPIEINHQIDKLERGRKSVLDVAKLMGKKIQIRDFLFDINAKGIERTESPSEYYATA